ncbi:hypothetical protein AVEN_149554-1, partial [Araneus ventricosus]
SDNPGKSKHSPTLFVIFVQDGAPPHFHHEVQQYLNDTILTLRFLSMEYTKDSVYVLPVPATPQDPRNRIVTTVSSITRNQLLRVWQEMDYRFDVCRITNRAHG